MVCTDTNTFRATAEIDPPSQKWSPNYRKHIRGRASWLSGHFVHTRQTHGHSARSETNENRTT